MLLECESVVEVVGGGEKGRGEHGNRDTGHTYREILGTDLPLVHKRERDNIK